MYRGMSCPALVLFLGAGFAAVLASAGGRDWSSGDVACAFSGGLATCVSACSLSPMLRPSRVSILGNVADFRCLPSSVKVVTIYGQPSCLGVLPAGVQLVGRCAMAPGKRKKREVDMVKATNTTVEKVLGRYIPLFPGMTGMAGLASGQKSHEQTTIVKDEGAGQMSSTTKVNTSTVVNIPAPQLPSLSVPLGQEQKPMPNPHQKPIFPELPYFYIPVPASDPSLQSAAGREAPPKQSPSTDGDAGGQKNAELASGLIGAGGTLLALALCVLIWKFVRPCVRDFHRFRQNSRRGSRPTTPTTPRRQRSSSLLPMSPLGDLSPIRDQTGDTGYLSGPGDDQGLRGWAYSGNLPSFTASLSRSGGGARQKIRPFAAEGHADVEDRETAVKGFAKAVSFRDMVAERQREIAEAGERRRREEDRAHMEAAGFVPGAVYSPV